MSEQAGRQQERKQVLGRLTDLVVDKHDQTRLYISDSERILAHLLLIQVANLHQLLGITSCPETDALRRRVAAIQAISDITVRHGQTRVVLN